MAESIVLPTGQPRSLGGWWKPRARQLADLAGSFQPAWLGGQMRTCRRGAVIEWMDME